MNESRASEREFGFSRFRGNEPETPPLVENRGWNWSLTTSSDARQWGLPNLIVKIRENQSETFCVSPLALCLRAIKRLPKWTTGKPDLSGA